MVKCCVLWCENDSLKHQNVSFHQLPPHISKPTYICAPTKCKEALFACSEHYKADDFIEDPDGNMQLKPDSVPVFQFCSICLQTNIKLVDMTRNNLNNIYQEIVGVYVNIEDVYLNNSLCIQCAHRLRNFHSFKEKCNLASTLLLSFFKKKQINKRTLNMLNHERSKLKSTLSIKKYDSNYFDVKLIEDIENITIKIEEDDIKYKLKNDLSDINIDNYLNIEIPNSDDKPTPKKESNKSDQCFNENELTESSNSDNFDNNASDSSITEPILKRKTKIKTAPSIRKKATNKSNRLTPSTSKRAKDEQLFKTMSIDGVDDLFIITKRSEEEQMAELFKREESDNYKKSAFPCKECFRGFVLEKSYTSHMLRHSDECGMFSCKICKLRFKTSTKLVNHKHSTHRFEFKCKICSYTTSRRYRAMLHYEWHKGKMYECPHCTESFKVLTTFMTHLKSKHPADFVCQMCGCEFVSELALTKHMNSEHKTSGKVPEDGPLCEPCNVRFVSDDAYNTHLDTSEKHKNDRMKSNDVQEPIINLQDLICEQCGMQMADMKEYNQHFRKMHPDKNRTLYRTVRPSMCDKCGRLFHCESLLKDHLNIHTNEKKYKCTQCDKTYSTKIQLTFHSKMHKNIRYPCNICGKGFSSYGNRQRHMSTHSDARPYKCDICLKSFKTNGDKNNHINFVHLKKPWPKRTRDRRGQKIQSTEGASEADIQTWLPDKDVNDSDYSL